MLAKEMLIKELTRPYGKELINGLGWRKSWVDNNEQIQGWSAKEEHLALYNAARIGTEDVLEIGCFLGRSTVHLAAGLKISGRGNMVHILDPFPDPFCLVYDSPDKNINNSLKNGTVLTGIKNIFTDNIKKCEVADKVSVHHACSSSVHGAFQNESVGVLFIDGDHSYESVKKDYNLYFSKVINGGFIIFHDSIPEYEHKGVIQLISELDADKNNGLERITTIVSLGIYRKTARR